METESSAIKTIQVCLMLVLIAAVNCSIAMNSETPTMRGGGIGLPDVLCSAVGGDNCTGFIPEESADELVSTLSLPNQCDQITDVDVYLDIEHNYLNHLEVVLVSPEGTEIELFSFLGEGKGQCEGDNMLAYLDSDAAASIEFACDSLSTPAVTGTFRPIEFLTGFNGENGGGQWQLLVDDRVDLDDPVKAIAQVSKGIIDQGFLLDWGMNISCNGVLGPQPTVSVPTTSNSGLFVMFGLFIAGLFFARKSDLI